jgi:urate oxidase
MTDKDRLLQVYLEAKAEFERVAHSGTIMSEEYSAARDRAKAAFREYSKASSQTTGYSLARPIGL